MDRSSSQKAPFFCGLLALTASSLMFFFGSSVWVLIVGRTLQGISAAFVWTGGMALMAKLLPSDGIGTAIGLVNAGLAAGELGGPFAGGIFYDLAGERALVGLSLGVIGVDFVLRLLLVEKRHVSKTDPGSEQDQQPRNDYGTLDHPSISESREQSSLLPRVTTPKQSATVSYLDLLKDVRVVANMIAPIVAMLIRAALESVSMHHQVAHFKS